MKQKIINTNNLERIKMILKKNNVKITNQRIEIINFLMNEKRHIKAEEIYNYLKDYGVGLATVYRNLEKLKSLGIITEINYGKERYFEMKLFSKKSIKIHMKCEKCNQIMDFYDDELSFFILKKKNFYEEQKNIKIKDISLNMIGICEQCETKEEEFNGKTNKT